MTDEEIEADVIVRLIKHIVQDAEGMAVFFNSLGREFAREHITGGNTDGFLKELSNHPSLNPFGLALLAAVAMLPPPVAALTRAIEELEIDEGDVTRMLSRARKTTKPVP